MKDENSFLSALPFSEEHQNQINKLTENDIIKIDEMLITQTAKQWRKVARVVGWSMMELKGKVPPVIDIYYAMRVIELKKAGIFESQGDLTKIRFSEIRLAK